MGSGMVNVSLAHQTTQELEAYALIVVGIQPQQLAVIVKSF